MLKHYKGDGSLYSYNRYKDDPTKKEEHKNGIFFDTTKHLIYLNGETYGGGDNAGNLVTSEPIRISGGPLALEFNKDGNNISAGLPGDFFKKENDSDAYYTIPQGTSVLDLLKFLFQNETWPTITDSEAVLKANFSSATFTGITNNDVVDVGSIIKITKIATGKIEKSATAASSGTFTYGYSTTTDKKDIVSGSKSFSGNLKANTVSLDKDYTSHKFTFSLDLSNVSSKLTESTKNLAKYNNESKIYTYEISGITSAAWETTANITDEIGFEVVQNSNTVSYSLSTDSKLQASFDAIPSYYVVSSLNNLDATKKSEGVAAATKKCDITDITNSNITVVGAHPIYTTGLVGSGGISTSTNDNAFNDDAEQAPLESWKVDGQKYESLELITNANKKIIPNKLDANSVTNGNDAFYMYIGFGVEQVDGAKVTGNKIVLLPEGWYVDKLKETNNKYVSGPVVYEGLVAKKFDTGIPVYRVTKDNFDLCPPLVNMKSVGNIEYIEDSNDLFKVKNPITGHKHNYTAWCFENAGAKDLIRIKISKTVNNFTDDDLTQ